MHSRRSSARALPAKIPTKKGGMSGMGVPCMAFNRGASIPVVLDSCVGQIHSYENTQPGGKHRPPDFTTHACTNAQASKHAHRHMHDKTDGSNSEGPRPKFIVL